MFDFYYHRLIFMSQDRGTFPPTGIPFKISYFLLILKKSQLVFKKMPPLILQQAYRSNQNKTSMVLPIYVMTDILTAWHSRITKSFWMKTLWKLKPQLITLLWYLLHPNWSKIGASESMKIRENPTVAWILLRKCRNVDVLEDLTDLVDLFGLKKVPKEALSNGLWVYTRLCSKIFCCTWIPGRQKFGFYIRMKYLDALFWFDLYRAAHHKEPII